MQTLLGDEFPAFAASYEKPLRKALRVNPLRGTVPEALADLRAAFPSLDFAPVPWCGTGFYYTDSDTERPGRHPYHEAGLYYIQEPSAMAVAAFSGVQPGERVLDLCAAPGGKTTALAGAMRGEGILVANEIDPVRAKALSQNVERMGIRNALVTNMNPQALAAHFPAFFDRIIADAPCSGEGMFRKEEAARTGWSEDNIRLCAARQDGILDAAADMLTPGGTLVYSTCTFAPEEDEGSIARFLARHAEFHVTPVSGAAEQPFRAGHAEWCSFGNECSGGRCDPGEKPLSEESTSFAEAADKNTAAAEVENAVRLWPHCLDGEGHFLCVMKKDGVRTPRVLAEKVRTADKAALTLLHRFLIETLEYTREPLSEQAGAADPSGIDSENAGAHSSRVTQLCAQELDRRVVRFGDELYLLPAEISLDGLKVLRAGLDLGSVKKERFEPAHALALALPPEAVKSRIAFQPDDPRLIGYLKGNTIVPDPVICTDLHGWTLVCAGRYGLGWAKAAGGVLKNHYPKGIRWMY